MGRPPTPKSKAKTILIGALVAPEEYKAIGKAIKESGQDKSKWLRKAAMDAARPVWIICDKWGAGDLSDKTVEFDFSSKDGKMLARGWGYFFILPHRDGAKLAIEIHSPPPWGQRIFLSQSMANQIERHPSSSVADFRCVAVLAGLKTLG